MNIFKYCMLSIAVTLQATTNFTNEHLEQVRRFSLNERSIFIFSCMYVDQHEQDITYTPKYLLDGAMSEAEKVYQKAKLHDIDPEKNTNTMFKECVFPAIQHLDLPEEIWNLNFKNIVTNPYEIETLQRLGISHDQFGSFGNYPGMQETLRDIYMGDIAVLISHCFDINIYLDVLNVRNNKHATNININTLNLLNKTHENLSIDLIEIDSKNLCEKFIETKKSLNCLALYINVNNGTYSKTDDIVSNVNKLNDKEEQSILEIISQINIEKLSLIIIDNNQFGTDINILLKRNPEFIRMIEKHTNLPLQPNHNKQLTFHKNIFDFSGMLENLMALSPQEKTLFIFECIFLHNISQQAKYYTGEYKLNADEGKFNPYDCHFDPLNISSGAISEMNELKEECNIDYMIKSHAFKIFKNTNMPKEIWSAEFAYWNAKNNPYSVTCLAVQASDLNNL